MRSAIEVTFLFRGAFGAYTRILVLGRTLMPRVGVISRFQTHSLCARRRRQDML